MRLLSLIAALLLGAAGSAHSAAVYVEGADAGQTLRYGGPMALGQCVQFVGGPSGQFLGINDRDHIGIELNNGADGGAPDRSIRRPDFQAALFQQRQ